MKHILYLLVILASQATLQAQSTDGDQILGKWEAFDKSGIYEVFKQDGKYFARLIYGKLMRDAQGNLKKDTENPDKSLRSREWYLATFLWDLEYKGDNEYEDGTVYRFSSGSDYSCNAKVNGNTLTLSGYIGFSWISKSMDWYRVE